MSYGLTTFAIAMVFSTLVPYVPVFAMVFFTFKYYVDKYNLSFVYNTEFHGVGIIKRRVVPLTIFNIIVYQMINVGFFASKAKAHGKNYLYVGLTFVTIELLILMAFHLASKRNRYFKHQKMRADQDIVRRENMESHKNKILTSSMVEGTIVQNKLELGILMGGDAFMGADEDYASLLDKR